MLKNLMKYDLQWIIGKVLSYYSVATFVLALLARGTAALADRSMFWFVVDRVFSSAFLACAIAILINALMRSLVCFRRTLYGDPSYLTHTLPIKRGTVFTAKVLAGVISLLFSIVVSFGSAALLYLTQSGMREKLHDLLQAENAKSLIVLLAAVLVLELLFMLLCAVFGLVLGHRRETHRIFFSVAFAVAIYVVLAGVILGIVYAVSLIDPQMHALFQQQLDPAQMMNTATMLKELALCAAVYALMNLAVFFAAKRVFQKGVDVE